MDKTIKIDLRDDCAHYTAGYLGEHNHRALEITPPGDLRGAAFYMLAFSLDTGVLRSGRLAPGRTLRAPVCRPVTQQSAVQATLEAYSEDGAILGKSRMVTLRFERAVHGQPADPPESGPCPCTLETLLAPLGPTFDWILNGGEPPENL